MIQNSVQQRVVFIITFIAYFITSIAVFFSIIWLIPRIVLAETILWFLLAITTILIIIKNNQLFYFRKVLQKYWFILPFVIFSGFSIFWSIYWDISAYRWLVLFFTIIIGGYIGSQYSLKETVKSLTVFGTFILLISTLLVIFVPDIGVMHYHIIQGAWKGIFWHKNHMGLFATFINIIFFMNFINSILSKEKPKFIYGVLYIFSLFFIYKTDSVAAYMTAIFLHGLTFLALIWLKIRQNIRYYHYLIIAIGALFILVLLFSNIDQFFSIFNRNASLTGRIPMWTYLYETYISKRPLLGYGFNAFWYLDSHRTAIQQAAGYPDPIVIADNGFIDILVNIGFVGLFSFLILYLGVWWHSIKSARKANDIFGFFPIIFMAFTLIANISWSLIFENESFFFLIMISILFCITKSELKVVIQTN
jgi:exopolysaccharide production protein ExoQ